MNNLKPVLLLLSCGIVAGCSRTTSLPPQTHPVSLMRVGASTSVETTERYTAAVLPNQQVDLSFKTGGYVQWIAQRRSEAGGVRMLDAGDVIDANAPLARLRAPEMRSQVEQAVASVAGSAAAREGAEAQLAQARADAERAEGDWSRAQRLYAQTAMTRPDFEAAKSRYLLAQAQIRQATEAIAAQDARVQSSRAQQTEAASLLADTEIRSPFAGVVLSRGVSVGALVASGSAAFTVAEIDKVKVVFSVPDTRIGSLHLGDRLAVSCDAVSSQPLSGVVTVVAAGADDQSSTFRVEVTLANGDHRIRPGMVATVILPSAAKSNREGELIPMTALLSRPELGSRYGVFVSLQEGGKGRAHLQQVQPGAIEGARVVILSGLTPGMEIVTRGNTDLQERDLVVDTSEGDRQ